MSDNTAVKNGSDIIVSFIFLGAILAIFLLALVLIFQGLTIANNSINGDTYATITKINETGFANNSGYQLVGLLATGTSDPVINIVLNRSSGAVIGLGNVSVSSTGLVKNASAVIWNNLSLTYSYQNLTTNSTGTNAGITDVKENIFEMVLNFFALAPTIGTILGIVILIVAIVLLVLYVKRMKDSGNNKEFNG